MKMNKINVKHTSTKETQYKNAFPESTRAIKLANSKI